MNRVSNPERFALLLVSLVALPAVRAQCPDGSPPPCRAQQVAVAPRRVNPPLDDRTWIVVPFDNLAKNSEAEWMRGASVNLLYLGMSRWTDVRVIDDERVADLMRGVPDANNASLSLNAGLAVARRAGAGKLVMGDVLKIGNRTAVTAKVFDVKSGQRVRSVREETAIQDSVMPMFGKLAQKVLNIAPPQGANVGVVGTMSMAAYQEYAEGMQALNLFDLARARSHFERALQLDSTFALAHAKLSVLGGWVTPNDPANRQHAEAAARLAGSLPPREKTLINANVAFSHREYVRACEGFSALIRSDSTDTDAWYGLGDCLFHDNAAVPTNGDTTRIRWRGDLNASVRAFQRALELDPTYHLAYQHIVDAYSGQFRGGSYCVENRCTQYIAVVRPSGDSLLIVPLTLPRDSALFRAHLGDYLRNGGRKRMLERARQTAEQWVAANPSEERARLMHANVLLFLGRVAEADSTLRHAKLNDSTPAAGNAALDRLEIAVKLWRTADALRLYDSARASPVKLGATPSGPVTAGGIAALFAPVFGQMAAFDSLITSGIRQSGGGGGTQERSARESVRLMVGIPTDSFAAAERAAFEDIAARRGKTQATGAIAYPLTFGLRMPRQTWPPIDTTVSEPRVALVIAYMRRDTTAIRAATHRLDSLSSVFVAALVPDTGITLVAAEGYLALRDSALALRMARRWLDSSLAHTSMALQSGGTLVQPLIPRAMLLRADLAAALGQTEEARLWYKRLLDFWMKAEPEFQPLIERVKKSYAAVGGS
jgi:tetratricopeptide (TPR) repeat protein